MEQHSQESTLKEKKKDFLILSDIARVEPRVTITLEVSTYDVCGRLAVALGVNSTSATGRASPLKGSLSFLLCFFFPTVSFAIKLLSSLFFFFGPKNKKKNKKKP